MAPIENYMKRKIFELAWPVTIEMFGIMLVGAITTAMAGRMGAISLAAFGLAVLVQTAATMILAAAGTGAAVIVARETGAKNFDKVGEVAGQALLLGLLSGSVVAILSKPLAIGIFNITKAEPEVIVLAGELLEIMLYSAPFFLLLVIGNYVFRGIGRTNVSLVTSLSNSIIAVTFSGILTFGVGTTSLGVYGAAWGITIGQVCSGILAVIMMVYSQEIQLKVRHMAAYRPEIIMRILRIGVPAALEQLALQGGRLAFTFMLAGVGAVQFAGHQVAMQVESISFLPGFSFSIAAMTLMGQSLGRKTPHRAAQYIGLIQKIALWGMLGLGAFIFIFAQPLTALFINDPEVQYWGAMCVRIAALEQPTIALCYVYGGALRGAGDTRWPMYVTTTGIWLVRIPLIYVFIILLNYPVTVAWFITAGDFLVRSLILYWRYSSGKWKIANHV